MNKAYVENVATTVDDCCRIIDNKAALKDDKVVIVALGPSGSGKTTLIKSLMDHDVAYICSKSGGTQRDFDVSIYAVTVHSKGKLCDVVANMNKPMKDWAQTGVQGDELWVNTLQRLSYEDRSIVYKAMRCTGTEINKESSRFFATYILRHQHSSIAHYYVDLPGWEPANVKPHTRTGQPSKTTEEDAADVASTGQFIRTELLNFKVGLKTKGARCAVNYVTILRTILAKCNDAIIIKCSGYKFKSFGTSMEEFAMDVCKAYYGKGVSKRMLLRLKSPRPTMVRFL